MTDTRLDFVAGDAPTLPDVCLQCGAPATERELRTLSWSPLWTGILLILCSPMIFAAVALILMKRRRLEVPLCAEHRDWWRWRQHILMGSLLFNLVWGGFLTLYLSASQSPKEEFFVSAGGIAVGLLVWLAALIGLRRAHPRPGKITHTFIQLWGVAEEFARAQQQRGALLSPQLDDAARQHWNPNEPHPRSDEEKHIHSAEEQQTSPDTLQQGGS